MGSTVAPTDNSQQQVDASQSAGAEPEANHTTSTSIPPKPANESARLRALDQYRVLDTLPEHQYDDLTRLASYICDTPISLVSLVDRDRQWFKAKVGLKSNETPRDVAFCSHAILGNSIMQVKDAAQDERFRDNPLVVSDPCIRFYAGAPLITPEGLHIGTMCVIDRRPRELSERQLQMLEVLARQVIELLELRRREMEAKHRQQLLERSQQELERSNSDLERFAYVASHDLQEPLRMVVSFTELLDQHLGAKLDSEARKYMDFAVDGAKRMQRLIRDILSIARIRASDKAFAPVDTNALVETIAQQVTVATKTAREVVFSSLPTVHGDETQLEQLFGNLISNAMKFNESSIPRVEISAVQANSVWEFAVSDNGLGIAEKDRGRVFEVFQRLHGRSEYEGSGIGLAIVSSIVARHGGRIWVDSSPIGGTTFRFTLPQPTTSP